MAVANKTGTKSMNEGRLVVEHPVLWSEERRRIEEKRIADDGLKAAYLRKERQRRDSLIEQQEVKIRRTRPLNSNWDECAVVDKCVKWESGTGSNHDLFTNPFTTTWGCRCVVHWVI